MQLINLDSSKTNILNVINFILQWNNGKDSINQQTSGSTGKAKTIKLPKWKMQNSAEMTGEKLGLYKMKNALICMNSNYIGSKMMIVRALRYNLDLIVTEVTSNPLKNIDFPIDFAAMVPFQVEEIIRQNPEKLNLIGTLIIGGASVSTQLEQKLKKFNCIAYSTFGMTETVSHIALKDLKIENSPFRVIGNTVLSVQNDCLVISNENLGIEKLKTNDIVELIDEKSFFWKGRADFIINSGGVKINPEVVEEKIKNALLINNFVISSLPDDKLGNAVIFIGEEDLKTNDLQKKIEGIVDVYERPKTYYFIPSLVRTASGKINRLQTLKTIR